LRAIVVIIALLVALRSAVVGGECDWAEAEAEQDRQKDISTFHNHQVFEGD
jgi:hypothetical protein